MADAPPPITVTHNDASSAAPPRQNLHERRANTWDNNSHHRRKHSPDIAWHSKWSSSEWKNGRVLLIDYVSRSHITANRRKIVAQEFCDIDGLRRFYANQTLFSQAALRVIHVQNASWATRFLLRKFNIDASDDLVGTSFGRWARYERPKSRGGKPVLNGKTFRTQRDPWRGIVRAGFGLDYLRSYDRRKRVGREEVGGDLGLKMMELNGYDVNEVPAYCHDAFVQRLSVYVQRSVGEAFLPPEDADIRNPYDERAFEEYQKMRKKFGDGHGLGEGEKGSRQHKYVPKLSTLDNGTTAIKFLTN